MINKIEDIKDLFDIFHDGDIVEYSLLNKELHLDIEIPYLAERIDKNFKLFRVVLYGCQNIIFTTWPNEEGMDGEIISDVKTIFKPKLWILSASIEDGKIEVNCSQTSSDFNYCGGNLCFNVESVKVSDENGKQYTIDELAEFCEEYWDEWENNNKKKV